jgi:hypothetical protein
MFLQRSCSCRTFEQRWTLALLLGLIVLFDYPLFACEVVTFECFLTYRSASSQVFAASKVASLTLSTLYIYGAFAFVGALLCFFLFVVSCASATATAPAPAPAPV